VSLMMAKASMGSGMVARLFPFPAGSHRPPGHYGGNGARGPARAVLSSGCRRKELGDGILGEQAAGHLPYQLLQAGVLLRGPVGDQVGEAILTSRHQPRGHLSPLGGERTPP